MKLSSKHHFYREPRAGGLIPLLGLIAILFTLIFFCAPSAHAQTFDLATPSVSNLYMAGASYNSGATPAIAGTALYAHQVNDSGTYAFTLLDVLPTNYRPLTVTTNIGAGIAQKIATIGKVPIFIPTAAGISYSGTNTGWAWSTGVGAPIRIKSTNWYVMPNLRFLKSSVSGGTGYQPILGVLIGWGQ